MINAGELKVVAKGDREIIGTREFNAPRKLVWDAFTRPELLKRWFLGPPGWVLTVCDIDLKVGGAYRYVWRRANDGMEMGMGGTYLEIKSPEKLVSSEKFDQAWYPGGMTGTLELADLGARTAITHTFVYDSKEARDGVLRSPMEQGMEAAYQRLDAFLAEMSVSENP